MQVYTIPFSLIFCFIEIIFELLTLDIVFVIADITL